MLIFNFLIFSISLWVIVAVNHKYLQPALKNRQRFKLYKLRDELVILAMKGEVREDAEEYLTLIKLLNQSIRASGSFKVTNFLKFLYHMHKNKQLWQSLESIIKRIKGNDNANYCRIARDYFKVLHEMMHSNTRVLRYIFIPVLVSVAFTLAVIRVTQVFQKLMADKQKAIKDIDEDLGKYQSKFGEHCPC